MFPTRRIIISGGDVFRDEYSLAFDGSDEVLQTEVDGTAADATYVLWMKSSESGTNNGIFGHGSNTKGAFHLNVSSKILWQRGSANYKYWENVAAQDDGQWHHWAIVNDHSDISACLLYIDGVLQTVSGDPQDSGSVTAYGDLVIGGDAASGGNYGVCSISDFTWYDTLLSSSQIKTLYNGGEPYNHREGIASSNLKGWWRMGDGALDGFKTGNGVIGDELNQSTGAELMGDPNFETDVAVNTAGTHWTTGVVADCGWTISGGSASQDGSTDSGGDNFLRTSSNVFATTGIYEIVVNISSETAGALCDINNLNANILGDLEAGITTTYYISDGSARKFGVDSIASKVFDINSVSIRKINGSPALMLNMEAGDFKGDTP